MAAITKITTESQTDKTPNEVIAQLNKLADKMFVKEQELPTQNDVREDDVCKICGQNIYSHINCTAPLNSNTKDYAEKLALEILPKNYQPIGRNLVGGTYDVDINYEERRGFIKGYNKAKENTYTEEQVIGFAEWLASNWFPMWVKDKFVWEHDWDKTCEEQKYKGYYTEKELFQLFLSLKK